jgi:hypothetical protein
MSCVIRSAGLFDPITDPFGIVPVSTTSGHKDGEFELDVDIDLDSPFLCSMLSDKQLVEKLRGTRVPVVSTSTEMTNREPTKEEWANM